MNQIGLQNIRYQIKKRNLKGITNILTYFKSDEQVIIYRLVKNHEEMFVVMYKIQLLEEAKP